MNGDGPSTRAILRVVGVLLAVTLALWLIWVSRGVLTWVAIAAFLAVAINPLVNLLQDRLRLRRAPSILIVYVLVAGLATGAALLFVPPLIDAAQELTDEVPRYAERSSDSDLVQRLDEEYDLLDRLEEETTSALEGVAGPDTAAGFSQLLTPGGAYYTEDMWRKETPGEYYTYCNANFGLAGTLIEKISGQNFYEFLSENLFIPLGITGSYIAEGVTDLNNLAVIYRNEEGKWAPQTDDFKGTLSSPRDFSGYKTGTNAAVFSPQGGLRISALELARVMMLHLDKGTFNGKRIISKKSIRLMHTPQWTYNGNNGDTDGGKDKCYGLSVHILTNTPSGDVIYRDSKMMGHGGDAYGLISKFYFDPETRSGLILITNGIFNPLTKGSHSVFYDFEEAVFSSVRQNSLFRCPEK